MWMTVLADASLPLGTILTGLVGGLALFLFGMDQMADGLKLVAGDGLRTLLGNLTRNRFTGVFAGALVTSIIQSSSITTVLVVGFVSAGLMTMTQSIGIVMGANIGSTITAQIIAFKVTDYALVIVAVGFFMSFILKSRTLENVGRLILGLGLVFFGMKLMTDGTYPLRSYPLFIDFMQTMNHPLLAILISALFTGIVQSSAATTGMVIVFASQGLITLEASIALIFGANIGTCITALLAAIGKPREALQVALVHILFNVGGVLLWYAWIPDLAELSIRLSPTAAGTVDSGRLAADTPRQIANAHTIFNVSNMLVFIWFAPVFGWIVTKLAPHKEAKPEPFVSPRYLDPLLLRTPSLALEVVPLELGRLGRRAARMSKSVLRTVIHGSEQDLSRLEQMDNEIDQLHTSIITYLGALSRENLSDQQSERLHDYLATANYIESIGDIIETNLVDVGRERIRDRLRVSEKTERLLDDLATKTAWAVDTSVTAVAQNRHDLALEVILSKKDIKRLGLIVEKHLSRRLSAEEPSRTTTYRLEAEIEEYLKRMHYFARRVAKLVPKQDVAYASPVITRDESNSTDSMADESMADESMTDHD